MNERGVSLINVMVAMGVTAIVGFALTQMIVNSMKAQSQASLSQSATNLQLFATGQLSSREICTDNFGSTATGGAVTPATNTPDVNQLVVAAGGPSFLEEFAVGGREYEGGVVRISSIRFTDFRSTNATNTEGIADLTLGITTRGSVGVTPEIFRTVQLDVQLSAANGPIQTCVALGNDEDDAWRRDAADNIFYLGNNVGIGTDNPTQRLQVNGSVLVAGGSLSAALVTAGVLRVNTAFSQSYLYYSDERLKDLLGAAPGLDSIEKLQGVSFRWKSTGRPAVGFIAQEVEKVFPEMVSVDPQSGFKVLDSTQLVGPLVESVKDLSHQNQKLEEQLADQHRLLQELESRVKSLSSGKMNQRGSINK